MSTPSDFARYIGIAAGTSIFFLILFGSMWFSRSTTLLYWAVVLFTGIVMTGGLVQFNYARVRQLMLITAALHFLLTIAGGLVLLLGGEEIGNLGIIVPVAIFDLVAFSFQRWGYGGDRSKSDKGSSN